MLNLIRFLLAPKTLAKGLDLFVRQKVPKGLWLARQCAA